VTEEELRNMVLEATGKTERELPTFRILGLVKEGLEVLAKRVASQNGYQGLQGDFAATPVAGRLDLDTLAGLLFDPALVEVRVSASNQGITIIDNVQTLEYGGLATDQVFCAREGNELVFRQADGSMNAYAQPVKIKANQIPTLATLKAQYRGALASIIAELAVGTQPRPELTGVVA
jgi:hypothetical protein